MPLFKTSEGECFEVLDSWVAIFSFGLAAFLVAVRFSNAISLNSFIRGSAAAGIGGLMAADGIRDTN